MDLNNTVRITEKPADPVRDEEEKWLVQWSKDHGRVKFFGEIVGEPELVLDHAAGRVYEVKTALNKRFFVIVGAGNPYYYPVGKQLQTPEEVLGYHRGSKLITKLKVNSFLGNLFMKKVRPT